MNRGRRSDRDRLRERRHVRAPRRGNLRAEDHARAQHAPPPEPLAQRLDIAESILHRDDHAVAVQALGERIRDRFGVVTLDRAQDQTERPASRAGSSASLRPVTVRVPNSPEILKPPRAIASRCARRPSSVTSWPASCSIPPRIEPIAPAPAMRMGVSVIVSKLSVAESLDNAALAAGRSRGLGSRDGTDFDSAGRRRACVVGDERVGRALGGARRDPRAVRGASRRDRVQVMQSRRARHAREPEKSRRRILSAEIARELSCARQERLSAASSAPAKTNSSRSRGCSIAPASISSS